MRDVMVKKTSHTLTTIVGPMDNENIKLLQLYLAVLIYWGISKDNIVTLSSAYIKLVSAFAILVPKLKNQKIAIIQ